MKIGFIDLYLSEWHANHFPEMLKKTAPDAIVTHAWAEEDVSPVNGKTTAQWCAEFGVQECKTPREVCDACDAIMIFAPDDPESHLRLAEAVLPYGKPTYIDKTFAPDLETAKKIFALAEQYHTPMYTSSSLGFAEEVEGEFKTVLTFGGGGTPENYLVHHTEMVVKLLGSGADTVCALPMGNANAFSISYPDDRRAGMVDGKKVPFALVLEQLDGTKEYRKAESNYFQLQAEATVEFFRTGIPPVTKERTLEVMAIREAALNALKTPGTLVRVPR